MLMDSQLLLIGIKLSLLSSLRALQLQMVHHGELRYKLLREPLAIAR